MTKLRILFVDDDPLVLEALRRMLRSMRHEWEMAFAPGGPEALEAMGEAPFDVIVSDMRMPGMDGSQLLQEVRRRHPEVVCIVLSGQSSEGMILRSVGPAHQYLSKPCDAETLRATVTRACALRDILHSDSLQRLVTQLRTLPSLPALYTELLEELKSPDVSSRRVGDIISQDVTMTAKMLQLVNSAFFGAPHRVSSPAETVTLLGLELVKALVLSVHVFSQLEEPHIAGFSLDALWRHSQTTAAYARAIAAAEGLRKEEQGEALLAGLLHDTVQLVLASSLGDGYACTLAAARRDDMPIWEAEERRLGASHAEVGAYLLGVWGLPDPIVEAVAYHEQPGRCPTAAFSTLTAVHAANALSYRNGHGLSGYPIPRVDEEHLKRLGVWERLPEWRAACEAIDDREVAA